MRDLSTVELGETVVVWAGDEVLTLGDYKGCIGKQTIVVDSPLGILSIDTDSKSFYVEDAPGHILGWVMDDAPLTTIPPELE